MQFTLFNTPLIVEMACLILSTFPVLPESWLLTSRASCDWLTWSLVTWTEVNTDVLESRESNICAEQMTLLLLLWLPAGRRDDPYDSCERDYTTIADPAVEMKPN